jgi:plastocyanin
MLRMPLVLSFILLVVSAGAPSAISAQTPPPIVIHEGGADPTAWGYTPTSTTVPVGTTVTWTNSGAFPHDAASTDGSWKTPLLDPGASGSVTFSTPGTYAYICTPHPWMQATIIVTAASAAPAPTATTQPADTSAAPAPTAPPAPTAVPDSGSDTGSDTGSN